LPFEYHLNIPFFLLFSLWPIFSIIIIKSKGRLGLVNWQSPMDLSQNLASKTQLKQEQETKYHVFPNESNARGPFLLPLTSSFTENLTESLTRRLQWGK
jgi:hypothetical protein